MAITDLVGLGSVLCKLQSALDTVCEEKAAEVEELCVLNGLFDFRGIEVARSKLLRGTEGSAERPLSRDSV
jgi:hypothetical protein